MKQKNFYEVITDKVHIKKEKQKATELKKTTWWKNKLVEGVCHYCGKKFEVKELTMDHIVPIARGGKTTKGNVVVCCFSCNQKKGLSTPIDEILDRLKRS